MTLKLGPIADDKPVRLTVEVPADIFRELSAYADAHARTTGQPAQPPGKLIVPMITQFMASDRGFAKARRTGPGNAAGPGA